MDNSVRIRVRAWGVLVLVGGLAIVASDVNASDVKRMCAQTVEAAATSGFEAASKGQVGVIVVDHVEQPSVN